MVWITNGESGSSIRTKLNTIPNNGTSFTGLTSGGALGTPSSGTLTNCVGLPIAGIVALGVGIATFLSSGLLGIANGGTGQTTANAAFNALSPMTTGGDLIYGGTAGAATRLANGTAGQVLTSNGTTVAPSWQAGMTNPMTTGGDIIYGGASGAPTRLANGTSQVKCFNPMVPLLPPLG